ncbi:hypothetical protein ACX0G9_29820 [Flavitalea flava]
MENINLEKTIWTEKDFENMKWHDSNIYAMSFGINNELSFDIDYIFSWVQPTEESQYFRFWVSPCTLIFENVYDLKLDIEISEPFRLEVEDIIKHTPQRPINADYIKREIEYQWEIGTQQGNIIFKSVGYNQFLRQRPQLLDSQILGFVDRGGISFDKVMR